MTPEILNILLIDDSEDDNFFSHRAIAKSGVPASIAVCIDGRDAMSYLTGTEQYEDAGSQIPDLIFLDINMPRMDGWEFLDAYQRLPDWQKPVSVVVMLTTSMDANDAKRARQLATVTGFLTKPLTPEYMISIASEQFGYLP
ncbi:MAG: response regulator [Pseudomonadales bacterium]